MHNNYYFLRHLSKELEVVLRNTVISECYSQNKDELIIRFETKTKPFFIKANLTSGFCCLSFSDDPKRARKNSVDLFKELIGLRVQQIRQFSNERCFSIQFNESYELLFKMHGNRSNLVLFHQDKGIAAFRNHLDADLTIQLDELNKHIDWSEASFAKNIDTLKKHYFTFGKIVWEYLERDGFKEKKENQKWEAIQEVLKQLEQPVYHITELGNQLHLSLLPIGTIVSTQSLPIAAVTEFFTRHAQSNSYQQQKTQALSKLNTSLKNAERYLEKTRAKLKEIESDNHYKIWADLIMANLGQIKTGQEKAVLENFYDDQKTVEIKLKRDLSAQKNAEVYYRKFKNHHIEIQKLKEAIAKKEQKKITLSQQINEITAATDAKSIRECIEQFDLFKGSSQPTIALPYHEFEFMGYKIWVGKDARKNDELTQKHSYKEDLWMHAKDVPGSHVLIKFQAGKKFPKEVIEKAAQLAAFNSKRKTETLCPVVYTPKKYVRKRKGDPPGTVIVERETAILVEPSATV